MMTLAILHKERVYEGNINLLNAVYPRPSLSPVAGKTLPMVASTPLFGGHYFVDVIAGIALSVTCWQIACLVSGLSLAPATKFLH
jgi:membrane-associated phospholipid phosphatase